MNSDLFKELFSVMMQLKQAFHKLSQHSFEDRSATVLQYATLTFLSDHPKTTMSDLAAHLRLSLSSATQLVERLVKTGFVTRSDHTDDRRIVHLTITNTGQSELQTMREKWEKKMTKIFSKIPQEDLKEYIRIQKLVLQSIQKEEFESR